MLVESSRIDIIPTSVPTVLSVTVTLIPSNTMLFVLFTYISVLWKCILVMFEPAAPATKLNDV